MGEDGLKMLKWMRESDPGAVSQVPILVEEPCGSSAIGCPTCGQASWGRKIITLRGYLDECHRDEIMAYKMPTCGCLIDTSKFRLDTIQAEVTYRWREVLPK
jgi:hypothetical protein